MRNLSAKTLAATFSPIGFIDCHRRRPEDMHYNHPHQHRHPGVPRRDRMSEFREFPRDKRDFDCVKMNKFERKSANVCFGGFFNTNKICQNELLKKSLEFASDNGALFAAGVALLTTTLLRPLAIFATPGVKKENKEYASAKSIASGILGFAVMAAVSTPVAKGIKKINLNPEKYLKPSTIANLQDGAELVKSKAYETATRFFKLGTDFVCAIPKAMLTCAFIPPIMNCLFPKPNKTIQKYYQLPNVYFQSNSPYNNSNQIFKGFMKEVKK